MTCCIRSHWIFTGPPRYDAPRDASTKGNTAMWYRFRPYVSVGQRWALAARKIPQFTKQGRELSPVHTERPNSKSFCGQAWCKHLELIPTTDTLQALPPANSSKRRTLEPPDLADVSGVEIAPRGVAGPKAKDAGTMGTKTDGPLLPAGSAGGASGKNFRGKVKNEAQIKRRSAATQPRIKSDVTGESAAPCLAARRLRSPAEKGRAWRLRRCARG